MNARLLTALFALAVLVAACGDDTDPIESAGPDRIVSLSPTATEMLFAIGAGDQVIAVDEFSNFPPEAPMTTLSGFQPNVEAIAGFEPDLVVSQSQIEGLPELGIENLVLPSAITLEDTYSQMVQLGEATGNESGAAQAVGSMREDIDAALADVPSRTEPLTYYHELDTTLFSVTSSTFIGQVYDLIGLENVADPADADGAAFGYPQLNAEYLVDADPDLIFLADTIFEGQSSETVAARPGWEGMSAVRSGRVVELNDDIASRWGPRIVEFIEVVAAAVADLEPAAA